MGRVSECVPAEIPTRQSGSRARQCVRTPIVDIDCDRLGSIDSRSVFHGAGLVFDRGGWIAGVLLWQSTFDALRSCSTNLVDSGSRSLFGRYRFGQAVGRQIAVARGQIAEAEGKPALAIEKYREAMRLDDWFAIHAALYERIGAIDFSFGRTDTLEFGLYHSQLLFSQKNYSPAIQELEGLFPKAGSQSTLLHDLLADRWTAYGTALYAKGAVAAAIPAWRRPWPTIGLAGWPGFPSPAPISRSGATRTRLI